MTYIFREMTFFEPCEELQLSVFPCPYLVLYGEGKNWEPTYYGTAPALTLDTKISLTLALRVTMLIVRIPFSRISFSKGRGRVVNQRCGAHILWDGSGSDQR